MPRAPVADSRRASSPARCARPPGASGSSSGGARLALLRGMGLLRTWLGPDAWQRFTRDHRDTQPFAMQGVGNETSKQCDWDHLGHTLAAHAPDVLVVRRGEDLAIAPPRSLADLQK